jgi:hypothetical protein
MASNHNTLYGPFAIVSSAKGNTKQDKMDQMVSFLECHTLGTGVDRSISSFNSAISGWTTVDMVSHLTLDWRAETADA